MSDFLERIAKLSPKRLALLAADLNSKLDRFNLRETEPIAVIGMSCRFPGNVNDADSFWRLMIEGRDAVREVPSERWDIDAFYDPDPDAPGKMSTRWGGFLEGVDQFDPEFFGISPREAAGMDPQQRLLLEVTWETLENAGQNPDRLAGSPTGVFVGLCNSDYFLKRFEGARRSVDAYVATGNAHSVASGRISYILGLKGPSLSVDTACSSSLTAVHLACQSLRAGECRMALAGGVNLILMPDTTIILSKAHMMSPDGRCKPFDKAADGFVRSEGCGIVLLKRLSDARADGDTILALIRGTACNQDGQSSGLTAPNGPSQVAIIREALANARLQPAAVDFVEAHGTGTSLGDPIEARALAEVFGPGRAPDSLLRVGSVKSNIGHAESAAGIAGLIKTILALRHGKIPPTLHLRELNPHIEWQGLAIGVPTLPSLWSRESGLRVAGVSSFGFSGSNAHVILSDLPEVEEVPGGFAQHGSERYASPLELLPLSTRSESALTELARRYEQFLRDKPDLDWPDICYTAGRGRAHFEHRLTIVAPDLSEAYERLADFQRGKKHDRVRTRRSLNSVPPTVVFMFTGQGSQYAGMGRELYATQPVFQRELKKCAEILEPLLDKPLLELLFGESEESRSGHFLDETRYTQPALFALEYALAAMWRSWGVEPSVVLGHSVGEYVAACVAGIFDLEDGLRLVTERGRLMATLPTGGTMAAVFAEEFRVSAAIAGTEIAIACINGPANIVISGESRSLGAVLGRLESEGVRSRRLVVSHAFHSSLMDPILDPFQSAAERVAYSDQHVAIVSNLTGRIASAGLMSCSDYWREHIRNPVQFAGSIRALRESGQSMFLEIGPHPVLTGMARMSVPEAEVAWGASLDRGAGNWESLLESVSMLYLHGVELDWAGLHAMREPKRIALPTYPFQRARYWLEQTRQPTFPNLAAEEDFRTHPFLGKRLDSPAIPGAVFQLEMGKDRPAFLNDHRIFGRLIMPSPAYIEMAMAGAAQISGLERTKSLPCEIVDLSIREPLFLSDEGACRVQLIFEEPAERGTDFRVCSKNPTSGATDHWRTHVTGSLQVCVTPRHLQTQTWNREEVWRRCSVEMDAGSYYDSLIQLGLEFGERFRGIVRIRRGDGEALAEIQLPESLAKEVDPYLVHPALLDSCFHLLGAALPIEDVQNAYLLIGIERFALFTAPPNRFWNHTVLRPGSGSGSEVFSGDITLYADDGQILAEISGLHLKGATALTMARADEMRPESWFYEVVWRERAISAMADREDGSALTADFIPTPVLLTGLAREELLRLAQSEHLGVYAEFLPKLESLSAAYIQRAFLRMGWSLLPGDHRTTRQLAEESGVLPSHRRLFERLVGILVEVGVLEPERDGWAVLKLPKVQSSDLQLEAERLQREFPACSTEVTLTARCAERLDEVLRGTCDPLELLFPNGDFDTAHALYRSSPFARASNTALRHVVARAIQDAPKDRLVRILEIGAGTGGTTSFLLPKLPADRTRYTFSDVSRLFLTRARDEFRNYPFARFELLDIEKAPSGQGFRDGSFDLIIAANVFHATRDLRKTLAHAATLLAAGGVLILLEGTRRQRWVDLTFGLTDGWWRFDDTDLRPDYALISAEQWKPLFQEAGLEVEHSVGLGPEAFEFVPQAILIGRKPLLPKKNEPTPGSPGFWVILSDTMGIAEEVATLISHRGEACVFVSKGSEYEFIDGSRATLDPLRPSDFTRLFSETVAAGNGQLKGVLNLWPVDEEISSEAMPSEWEDSQAQVGGGVLHSTQAFLALQSDEISSGARVWLATRGAQAVPSEHGSKTDSLQPIQSLAWGLARVISLEQPARFGSVIDLDPRASPQDCAAAIWDEMQKTGTEEAVAYRKGRRLVPRVVRAAEPPSEPLTLRRDGSYLITGGLGGLGLQVAEWIAAQGAGHIVLLSRHHFPERSLWRQLTSEDPNYRTVQRILSAEKVGTQIAIAQGDVADENGMRSLFERFGREKPPLRGIIHAAVEMTTRSIGELDLELFQRMCRAKALGGWVLHRLALHLDLDLFVFFSSTTALWGAAGLGHYAAANQALDLLAHWRRARGLRALSVNWGTWQEMRVASEADKEQFLRAGLKPMAGAQALDALKRLLAADRTSAIVASVDWHALRSIYEGRRLRPLFDEMRSRSRIKSEVQTSSKSADRPPEFRLQLQNASSTSRRNILITLLRSEISSILGFDLTREIELEQGLFDMGMDSLMSVELKGRLERSLGVPLPSTLTFNYPTIKALVDYLLSDALGFHSPPALETTPPPPASAIGPRGATASDDLSEEELSELLLKKLAELE